MSELFSLSVTADDATHHSLTSLASAAIAQLGERQTEDLKVPGSILGLGMSSLLSRSLEQGRIWARLRAQHLDLLQLILEHEPR